jgi:hypothetical protein
MTSTESRTEFTPAQKRAYRADIAGFMSDLDEVLIHYGVIEVGRVLPGDSASYTAVYVLRRWNEGGQYVTHMMYRIDDREGGIRWAFCSGHYFRVVEFDSRIDAINAASRDLAER